MSDITTIPHLRLDYSRRYFPQSNNEKNVLIINARDSKSLGATMSNPNIRHLNKYQKVYIPTRYRTKIFGLTVIKNILAERNDMFAQIKAKYPVARPENEILPTTNSLIYDMSMWNELFMEQADRAISFKYKCEQYIEIIKEVVRDQDIANFNKLMLIDIEEWGSFKNELGDYNYLDTPLLIIYYAMWKFPAAFRSIGDINIILFSNAGSIRVNPSLTEESSFRQLRIELNKLNSKIDWDDLDSTASDYDRSRFLTAEIINKNNLTGNDKASKEKIKAAVDKKVAAASKTNKEVPKEAKEEIIDVVEKDEELGAEVSKIVQSQRTLVKPLSKRDEELQKKQGDIKVKGKKLMDIMHNSNNVAIPVNNLGKGLTNKNMEEVRFTNFEKAYMDNHYYSDLFGMVGQMNDCEIPVYIRDIKVENTSDSMSFKETVTVQLEDANRVRHNVKFDIPIFVDGKFLYLNGNRKVINKQLLLRPVIKTKPDEVQVVTNYNKIFLHRYGAKLSPKTEKFRKLMTEDSSARRGDNRLANSNYLTTIEYDELAKYFSYVKVGTSEFYFSQEDLAKLAKDRKVTIPEDKLLVGFEAKSKPIFVDHSSQMIGDKDLVDYMVEKMTPEKQNEFHATSTGKKFLYTRATIMAKDVPLVLLLAYCEGLTTVLKKAEIKHYFTDKRPKLTPNEQAVQFADGYLVYEAYPYENSLLMNAFNDIPTKGFNYEEMDGKEAYGAIFETMFNQRNLSSAFDNFYDFMIDPISKSVLEDMNYPTDFVGVMIYASSLMADNQFVRENDLSLYRVRSNEIVSAYLYKALADSYGTYRRTAYNNNPTKISMKQDYILKQLLTAQTVEDYSTLNPIVEIEKTRVVSAKGPNGLNLSQAYTLEKRGYDPTMIGTVAMSTSPDANSGMVRQLSMEPKVTNARGYIEVMDKQLDKLTDVNMFSPAELASPLGVTRDDSSRTGMAVKQSKHIIPVRKSSPVLISNGFEKVIHHHIGKDFSVVAAHDGVVKEVDESTGMVVMEYADGSKEAFDISPTIVKNGAGGFYLSNKLDLKYQKGQKFKKNDVIAADEAFFSDSVQHGNKFNIGSLQKIAIMGGYYTYEDSTAITQKLASDMTSELIMVKEVTLGKNSNVEGLVKKGDMINVGDELLRFETSFEDDSINEMLRSFGGELQNQIQSLGKKPITSSYSGVIADVKVYTTVDVKELSPSLQKIVNDYHGTIKKKKNILKKHGGDDSAFTLNHMMTEPTTKVETPDGKVKGNLVGEGVLIQVFIKYEDKMGVGDKLAKFGQGKFL